MADSLTSGADLARKRSRSASPSHESAAKKANQATAAPTQLEVDDDMPAATDTTGDDADASAADPSASTASTLMNVDSAGIPAKPVAAAAAEQAAQDQAPAAQTIQMRTLIVTQDASIIIGRGGKNVNEIRDKSGAKITVTEAVPGNPERIMAVGGALDAVSKAFGLIVRRINDEPFDVPSVPGSRAVTIRFIIPNSRMGSVIGKAGAKIKEIQEASGAKLQASEAMLPGSTERVLSVSGVADAIHIAVYYLGSVLIEHASQAPREQSYRPSGDMGAGRPPRSDGPRPGGGAGLGPRVGADAQTQQLFVPNELVGSIIGKAGANINHIRQTSQCQIKVNEPGEPSPGGAPNERLITITGSPNGIQVAVRMLYERLEKEKAKQMGQ